ncbi:MAG: ABC transporter substrate-binding protein [Devosia sp.]
MLAVLAVSAPTFAATDLDALYEAAKAEGQLTTIALPHSWCAYGDVIDGFKAKYPGITVNELNPDAGSADEIEAIKANQGNMGPQAPDVIDVGLSFGPQAKADGLIQAYKVSTWDSIPDSAKDADGFWYGDYYGAMAFIVNKDLVSTMPTDWSDLMNDEYNASVALAGDPRASNQAIQGVFAAGMGTGADVDSAAEAGLKFFGELNAKGNFVPVIGKAASLAQGTTPILIAWDYNLLAWRDSFEGNPEAEIIVPKTGVVAGVYIQAISAYAPHPNAAKLWMEYLYSDDGQLGWLGGYCHPIRFNDMASRGVIPQDMLDALPPAAAYEQAVFPTIEQQNAAKAVITGQWDSVVGANVE